MGIPPCEMLASLPGRSTVLHGHAPPHRGAVAQYLITVSSVAGNTLGQWEEKEAKKLIKDRIPGYGQEVSIALCVSIRS